MKMGTKLAVEVERYWLARIDIYHRGAERNGLSVVPSGTACMARKAGWVVENGAAYVVESGAMRIRLYAKFFGNGIANVYLRGVDRKGSDGKRLPLWIDYTSFQVNGKEILEGAYPVCHDRPYKFVQDVHDGEALELDIQWEPHAGAEIALPDDQRAEGSWLQLRKWHLKPRKEYILLTSDITIIGGMQAFTAGKARYLEEHGWDVHIFTPSRKNGNNAVIPFLDRYLPETQVPYRGIPPYTLPDSERERAIRYMVSCLRYKDGNTAEIIVESHYDTAAYWGEVLAERIGGRHIFISCNEYFRPRQYSLSTRSYEQNLDFFYFKWKRNELIASGKALEKLFKGYRDVSLRLYPPEGFIREQDMVQDVESPALERLLEAAKGCDWVICYMGRTEKDYLPFIIEGVRQFAGRHLGKSIAFLLLGNKEARAELLQETFKDAPNVRVIPLGILVPVPRSLFRHLDVAIAGAMTGRFAAEEGVYTIVPDAGGLAESLGVLGYDTKEILWRGEGENVPYDEALENVLARRAYDGKTYSMPRLRTANECYEQFWDVFPLMSGKREYYTKKFKRPNWRRDTIALFPFADVPKGARVVLYGAGIVRNDYIAQAKELGYCEIVATVDPHSEAYDNSVIAPERLAGMAYDCIVLCAGSPAQAEEQRKELLEAFPGAAGKIVAGGHRVSTWFV